MSLNKAVKEARRAAGLSQEDAARGLDVSLRTYSRWERSEGSRDNISHRLDAIAKVFQTTPEAIRTRALVLSGHPVDQPAPGALDHQRLRQTVHELQDRVADLSAQIERVRNQQEEMKKRLPPEE